MIYTFELDNIDIDEFVKSIGFISEDIVSYERVNNELNVEIIGENSEQVAKLIEKTAKQYVSGGKLEKVLYENITNFSDHPIYSEEVKKISESSVVLNNKGIFLFDFFDKSFEDIAHKLGAVDKKYPVLLPIEAYSKTGYLQRTPQYSIFCSSVKEEIGDLNDLNTLVKGSAVSKVLKTPKFALSPSACFHTYLDFENQELKKTISLTFNQSVFRNEGRFNYLEIGRLMDYHVREIVVFGNSDEVNSFRNRVVEETKKFVEAIELNAKLVIASDPFIMPKMQKFKKIQVLEASKYELKLSINKAKMIAGASFNLHGRAFTEPFNIYIKNSETVSACVGYGIERWVIAFIGQYGLDENNWPNYVKEKYYESRRSSFRES